MKRSLTAGRAFFANHGPLAAAGVDQQAEFELEIALTSEIANGLGDACPPQSRNLLALRP